MTTPVDTSKKTSCIVGERTIPVGDTITAYPSDYSSELRRGCYINEANRTAKPDSNELINWCDEQVASFFDSLKDTYVCSDTGQLLDTTTKTPFDKTKKKTATFAPTGKSMDYKINSMTLYDHLGTYKLRDSDKVKHNDLIHAQVKYLPTELQTQLTTAMDSMVAGNLKSTNVKLYDSPTALCSSSTSSIGLQTNGLMFDNPIDFNTKCESGCEFKTNDHNTINIHNDTTHTLYKQSQSDKCADMMVQVKCDNSKLQYNDNYDGKTYIPYTNQPIYANCTMSNNTTIQTEHPSNNTESKHNDKSNNGFSDLFSPTLNKILTCVFGFSILILFGFVLYSIFWQRETDVIELPSVNKVSYEPMPSIDDEYEQ